MEPGLQLRIQRYGWNKASGYYESCWQRQLAPGQTSLLERALLKPGEQVLDVAWVPAWSPFRPQDQYCPAETFWALIFPKGCRKWPGKPLSSRVAKRFLSKDGAEDADLPGNSFDVALCALGLTYIPDPLRALSEMYRALKSGGRAAVLVWGERHHCGWAEIFPIVDRRVTSEVGPLFFQMGNHHVLSQAFCDAGFREMTVHYNSAEEACTAAFSGGPVALAYHRFDQQTRREAHAEYLLSIAPYHNQSGYDIPGEFLMAMGHKNTL